MAEKVVVVNFKDTLMGIQIKEIESFSSKKGEIYVNLKEKVSFRVKEVLSTDFLPEKIFKPSDNFFKITGALFIEKFFTFHERIGFIIHIKNFKKRLLENETE